MKSAAYISECEQYRYALWRWWDDSKPQCLFIGLNPSTADGKTDDPTIRRCVRFAQDWGYGSLAMANLFALRTKDPCAMMAHREPIGPDNNVWLFNLASAAGLVVGAWGLNGVHLGRSDIVRARLKNIKCLGVTLNGQPGHPLYIKADTPLIDYPE